MKRILFVLLTLGALQLFSQESEEITKISRSWTHVSQKIGIESDQPRKFVLKGRFKIESADPAASISLYFLVNHKDEDETIDYDIKDKYSPAWEQIEIEGAITKNTKSIEIGAYCDNNGKFYFDDFELFVENDSGELKPFKISNSGFDKAVVSNSTVPDWDQDKSDGTPVRVKEFTIRTIFDEESKSQVLLLEGTGIDSSPEAIGGDPIKGSTVQIEGMISMLNDLKERVESRVNKLSQYEVDHLHDENANRIGALIMHLAAAEAYYQVFTFESRDFNEEEKAKWQIALDLDEAAREKYKGNDIQYYLDIYNEVRSKTIEELRKRDDTWFKEIQRTYNWSNQYCWFHVMEHQSSHLGQILFLAKRIPPENKIELKEPLKN